MSMGWGCHRGQSHRKTKEVTYVPGDLCSILPPKGPSPGWLLGLCPQGSIPFQASVAPPRC